MSKPVTHNLSDSYRFYVASGGKLSKSEYRNIVCDYNLLVLDLLFKGEVVDLPNHVGELALVRFKNNFRRPRIDFHSTKLYKQELLAKGVKLYDKATGEGVKYFVYHTDEFGFRCRWRTSPVTWKEFKPYSFRFTRRNSALIAKHVKTVPGFAASLQENRRDLQ